MLLGSSLGTATLSTQTNDSQEMLLDFKLMLRSHGILNRFKLGGEELNDLATRRTDHVVVMLVFVVVFVVSASITEAHLTSKASFGE